MRFRAYGCLYIYIHTSSSHEDYDLNGKIDIGFGAHSCDAKIAASILFIVLVKLSWSHGIWHFNI